MRDKLVGSRSSCGAQDRQRPRAIVTPEPEPGRPLARADAGGLCASLNRQRTGPAQAPARRLIAFVFVLVVAFATGLAFAPQSAHGLRNSLSGAGAWEVVVVATVYVLLTCAMVPGPVLAGASGLLFGTALGTAVAIVSATLGATLAFLIARRFAHGSFEAIAGRRLRRWTARLQERGFLTVLYARIAPGAPFALVSYSAGMVRVRLRDFALATLIGASPRAFAYAALGGNLGNYSSPEALVALGVLGAMAIGGTTLLWRASRRRR